MPSLEVVPFADEHLEGAAALLRGRHERHRAAEPLLAEIDDFGDRIRAGGGGFVALRGGDVVAYAVAQHHERLGAMYGGAWACAASDADAVRDVYAVAAAGWVAAGYTRHAMTVPATDPALVDAWFRLGFGQQQAYAVREVTPVRTGGTRASVRLAGPDDIDELVGLDPILNDHQRTSPTFSGLRKEDEDDGRAEWEQWLADETAAVFLAEIGERAVGTLLLTRTDRDFVPHDGNVDLSWAVTTPEVRGTGAGVALTAAALEWARGRGFRTMTTDWRVTNLLSSRFWPRRGFRPAFLRLYRHIP